MNRGPATSKVSAPTTLLLLVFVLFSPPPTPFLAPLALARGVLLVVVRCQQGVEGEAERGDRGGEGDQRSRQRGLPRVGFRAGW